MGAWSRVFKTASFCWGVKAEFPNRRAGQQRDVLSRGRGHPAWPGGCHCGSSSLPRVALGPLGQVSSWPSPRDVPFLSRAFTLFPGMQSQPFFQLAVMQMLMYECPVARVPPPSTSAPQLSPLPGIRAPECKRLTECDRGLNSSLCAATNALGIGNIREKVENISEGPRPSRPRARCLASVVRGLPDIPAGVESHSTILRVQKLSPLPKKSELMNRGAQILTPACLSFHRHLPSLRLKSLPFSKLVSPTPTCDHVSSLPTMGLTLC